MRGRDTEGLWGTSSSASAPNKHHLMCLRAALGYHGGFYTTRATLVMPESSENRKNIPIMHWAAARATSTMGTGSGVSFCWGAIPKGTCLGHRGKHLAIPRASVS